MSAVSKNASDVTEPVSVTSSRMCLLAALPRLSLTPRGPAAIFSYSSRPCRDLPLLAVSLVGAVSLVRSWTYSHFASPSIPNCCSPELLPQMSITLGADGIDLQRWIAEATIQYVRPFSQQTVLAGDDWHLLHVQGHYRSATELTELTQPIAHFD